MSVPDIQSALELLRQREVDAAISSLKQKVEEIPAHLTAHVLLARAYEAKRDWAMALKSWENAHFLMPNSPIVTAGKERVIERINQEESAPAPSSSAPAPASSAPEPPANRGDASPSPEPPEPKASPSSREPSSEGAETDRPSAQTTSPSSPTPTSPAEEEPPSTDAATNEPAESEPAEAKSREETAAKETTAKETSTETKPQSPGETSSIAEQAQALLGNPPSADPEPSEASGTADSRTEGSATEDTAPSADASETGTDSPAPGSEGSTDANASGEPDADPDAGIKPPEAIRQIAEEFASPFGEDQDSASAEISTSRRPDTTSYRPDTAIIDAAASLLSQGPTPSAKSAKPDTAGTEGEDSNNEPANQEAPPKPDAGPHDASTGAGRKEGQADEEAADPTSADSFIPDFAAASASPVETEPDAASEGEASTSEQETRAVDPPVGPESKGEAPATRQPSPSYDTSEMPESRLLDELGPPPGAKPLRDDSDEEASARESQRQGETGSQSPEAQNAKSTDHTSIFKSTGPESPDVEPPSAGATFSQPPFSNQELPSRDRPDEDSLFKSRDATGAPSATTSESDDPSAKSETRPQASGSAIPNPADLFQSDTPAHQPSEGSADESEPEEELSPLDRLRRSAEQEARRGGARPDMQSRMDELSSDRQDAGEPDDTVGDLDRLIQDLESARIQPRPDLDELPTPDLEDNVEDLVSETLARIYAAQSQYREAARIYVKLASQEPANARDHLENAADMRKKAEQKEAEERAAEASSEE